jgi:hypothetical protein
VAHTCKSQDSGGEFKASLDYIVRLCHVHHLCQGVPSPFSSVMCNKNATYLGPTKARECSVTGKGSNCILRVNVKGGISYGTLFLGGRGS